MVGSVSGSLKAEPTEILNESQLEQTNENILVNMATFPLVINHLDVAIANRDHLFEMASIVNTALNRTPDGEVMRLTYDEEVQFDYHMKQITK